MEKTSPLVIEPLLRLIVWVSLSRVLTGPPKNVYPIRWYPKPIAHEFLDLEEMTKLFLYHSSSSAA